MIQHVNLAAQIVIWKIGGAESTTPSIGWNFQRVIFVRVQLALKFQTNVSWSKVFSLHGAGTGGRRFSLHVNAVQTSVC